MSLRADATDFVKNARIVRDAIEYATLLPDYLRTRSLRADDETFAAVHTYVMFIGIGRSGTTLIGSLLDAHPRIVIANQQTTLKYVSPPIFSRAQVFHLLLRNSREAARAGRPGGGGYTYAVEGQWQGRFETLEVIGDKSKSAQAVTWLTSRPDLLADLARVTRTRIRMIHVIRNPYDTIATRSVRRHLSLPKITEEYFALCDRLQRLIGMIEAASASDVQRIPLHLEDFIAQPVAKLAFLCDQLGVGAGDGYLQDCARILYRQPNKSRHKVAWNQRLVDEVAEKLTRVPFLRRYSFDE